MENINITFNMGVKVSKLKIILYQIICQIPQRPVNIDCLVRLSLKYQLSVSQALLPIRMIFLVSYLMFLNNIFIMPSEL